MLYKEYSMVHIKKISLTVLLIFMGCGIYKGCYSNNKRNQQNQTKKVQKTHMDIQGKANKEVTTPSGLSYTILQEAPQGAKKPQKGKTVTVHYTGYLDKNNAAGSVFDSSVKRGQPFQFVIGVGMVIKGWDEGVMDMSVGEKRRLTIPAHIGYGARGAGGVIPPNATLFFDVELLGVE